MRVDRPDRIGEAALLPYLVEQTRTHGAAEQCRVDRQRSPLARVVNVDRWAIGHPQVRLVGVPLGHEQPGRLRRRGLKRLRLRKRREPLEQAVQLVP